MNYFYDQNNVRYTLAATHGGKPINWLFLPGGPGCDSRYFLDLVELLNLEGNVWLLDLPGNGSHQVKTEQFDDWFSIFIPTIARFENPVLVGHSFGGMFPLLFNQLENLLSGFVVLSSIPRMHFEAAAEFAKKHNLPDLAPHMEPFIANPTQKSFNKALDACMPYYFPAESLTQGKKMLEHVPCAYQPAVWWLRKIVEISYNATWIPQKVPTLIIGGEFDGITPFEVFKNDTRFDRANIEKAFIKNAGHFPYVEQPDIIKSLFKNFEAKLKG